MKLVRVHPRYHGVHLDNNLAFLVLAHPLKFSHALIHLCLPTKDFCEKILMHSQTRGVAKRWGGVRARELAYMTLDECRGQLNVSHRISNKMFCMRRAEAARGAEGPEEGPEEGPHGVAGNSSRVKSPESNLALQPGTPVATVDRGTAYLTGLVNSLSEDDKGGVVFTKISRYLSWIQTQLDELNNDMIPQINQFPDP